MFDEAFEKLKNMSECLALELTDNTGEPLFFFEKKKDFGIKEISKKMNFVLQGIHELSNANSLGSIESILVNSSEYSMFSICSGEKERIHIHLFVVFSLNSNIALAKLAIDESIIQALAIVNT
ncbi:MAG: hypothetical protein COA44_05520 [Arcobacter sp.]|nr:MAG: hypothetical protein COA44_05520 [Arcobacter sp.]